MLKTDFFVIYIGVVPLRTGQPLLTLSQSCTRPSQPALMGSQQCPKTDSWTENLPILQDYWDRCPASTQENKKENFPLHLDLCYEGSKETDGLYPLPLLPLYSLIKNIGKTISWTKSPSSAIGSAVPAAPLVIM